MYASWAIAFLCNWVFLSYPDDLPSHAETISSAKRTEKSGDFFFFDPSKIHKMAYRLRCLSSKGKGTVLLFAVPVFCTFVWNNGPNSSKVSYKSFTGSCSVFKYTMYNALESWLRARVFLPSRMIKLVKLSMTGSSGNGTALLAYFSTCANCSSEGTNFSSKNGSGSASWSRYTSAGVSGAFFPSFNVCTAFNHSSTSASVMVSFSSGKTSAVTSIGVVDLNR
ncbi:hypothetical protein CLUG_00640 [Clavispora lusitaniae ATCC 42720]|uniref:Uncharacterized protein n=1 Tax=Clavispora lusitaniae (strain ATCC 42720) TaxID=306902 RepID=C4XXG7_CLAL4|nr:uncharacterized protein CLUG_00640 [Clavispora lusitaniae ATCC 42720]EEQ36517.1 hypothetical protein CLUG_00640 [Clavispora lusitaniae ATCC 42720]